jgi:hypothetical protein
MVKDKSRVEAKMLDRVRTAGSELKAGMKAGEDPIDVALKNVEAHQKKMADGLNEAIRTGRVKTGLQRAKDRNAWQDSIERAASHYEEAAPRMVANSMEDYEARGAAIERAKKTVANMPTTTRAQRIAKGTAYQNAVGSEFDKLYGRTG